MDEVVPESKVEDLEQPGTSVDATRKAGEAAAQAKPDLRTTSDDFAFEELLGSKQGVQALFLKKIQRELQDAQDHVIKLEDDLRREAKDRAKVEEERNDWKSRTQRLSDRLAALRESLHFADVVNAAGAILLVVGGNWFKDSPEPMAVVLAVAVGLLLAAPFLKRRWARRKDDGVEV